MLNQVALVSESGSISASDLAKVSAAIQKQISRDVASIWNIEATVDAFPSLDDVPIGYWPVIIMDEIPYQAGGIHLNYDNGQPYALVQFAENWSIAASHETLEMLVDPSGNRTSAANSPKPEQGRVLVLVEVCDPSEAPQFAYTVNTVLVSDFYTPNFFDPVAASGVRYSFTGAITKPLQVLEGGYVSWWDPESKHVFQLFVQGGNSKFVDRGSLPPGFATLRSFVDSETNRLRLDQTGSSTPERALVTGLLGGGQPRSVDRSVMANAESLRSQITKLIKSYKNE